jgi:putative SOS response-associated peptidase YedK
MKEVHNRMPLVIPKKDITDWLFDYNATNDILKREPPLLTREAV